MAAKATPDEVNLLAVVFVPVMLVPLYHRLPVGPVGPTPPSAPVGPVGPTGPIGPATVGIVTVPLLFVSAVVAPFILIELTT